MRWWDWMSSRVTISLSITARDESSLGRRHDIMTPLRLRPAPLLFLWRWRSTANRSDYWSTLAPRDYSFFEPRTRLSRSRQKSCLGTPAIFHWDTIESRWRSRKCDWGLLT